MEKLDKVEIVRQKTGVTYEEARSALEQTDYDVLDAIVLLEQQGKAHTQTRTAHHTTTAEESALSSQMVEAQQAYERSSRRTGFSEVFARLMESLKRLCARGLEVSFVVERNGEQVLTIPVLILVILILFLFPATIPLLIVGLFFGFRYHFEGVGDTSINVNDIMDRAADGAESIKNNVMGNE
ncbi:MAG: DUF4342 domain-containing protein [Atopobiaceae bacterium]|nr:DUF4342 domain-containing protein [Atopobiaceae bacterium]